MDRNAIELYHITLNQLFKNSGIHLDLDSALEKSMFPKNIKFAIESDSDCADKRLELAFSLSGGREQP